MDTVIEVAIGPGPAPGSYTVEVIRSLAGGEPSAIVALDVEGMLAALPQLESSILASSVSARRVMTTGESAIQSIGVRLFDTVFAEKVGAAYRASAAVASERGLMPQVALRLTAPELAALPWEALFDTEAGRYLSRKEPLVRRVSAPYSTDSPAITPPLRILGIVSSPRGLPMLDVDAEKERLEAALREHVAEGRVELVWLADVTWGGIQSALLREQWHVLHFIGHGGYDVRGDEGLLALVGSDGRADLVPSTSLADLLTEAASTPRLVVLNSCQSGATGTSDLFAGIAATLVRSGIPAVVAMQFAISDEAALAFARSFYVALATGRRIGESVRSGRIGILGTARDTLEWLTPVLYLRGDDARLLEPAERPSTAEREPGAASAPPPATETLPPVGVPRTAEASPPVGVPPTTGAPFSGGVPPTADASKPAEVPPASAPTTGPVAAPTAAPPGRGIRWPIAAAAGVLVVGGLTWGAFALWGGPPPPVAERSPRATTTPTETPPPPTPVIYAPVHLAVAGDAYWTSTGVTCAEGDALAITATGTILHEDNPASTVTPEGLLGPDGLPDPVFLQWNVPGVPDVATASLIGSLDRQEPFAVGSDLTFECPRAGELFLGINDINLVGNSGAWQAAIVKTDNPPLD